ncbi:MAG: penicillin-binding protein 2 [Candidatus Omnitrophica bacterium]|nr:penicillin-binding protein 2 [Candidatus Omnitrophota bacterium]
MMRPTNERIFAALLFSLAVWGFLWFRCLWLQVLVRPRYATIASSQHGVGEKLWARRGTIYDRLGRPLAVSMLVPSVYANARQVPEKRNTARQLANTVKKDAGMIQKRLEKDKGFVWIARHVEPQIAETLRPLRREGVGILEEPKRFYPHGELASHLLGFTNIDERGLEGLELSLNGILKGQSGWRSTLRDAKGHPLVGPWTNETQPLEGYDVVLTLDAVIQQVAEETLSWGLKKYRAKGGSIIVMDPQDGSILAMANAPTFNTNDPAGVSADNRRNRAVTDLFEPGSTFKIVTVAALLDQERISQEEKIFCENGAWPTVAHHILHDHRPHGLLAFHDVVKFSSNIGTAKAAQRLKPEELYRYIRAFGFGRPTGIDLPGEVSGIVHPPARWSKLSPYIVPIGQEVASTPIQLAVMTAVIANGGKRVRPHIVDRIQEADGKIVRSASVAAAVQIIRPETAEALQSMLVSVVESGTGQLAAVQGLTVAGKTGTAQKLEPNGRYSHSRFVASFVGFGPVPDSRFVIVVCMDEPRPLYFGGVVSAPMFKRMVEQLSGYWNLDKTVERSVSTAAASDRRMASRAAD